MPNKVRKKIKPQGYQVPQVGKNKEGKEKQHSVADRAKQIRDRKTTMGNILETLDNS
jgi:hypothetical protein